MVYLNFRVNASIRSVHFAKEALTQKQESTFTWCFTCHAYQKLSSINENLQLRLSLYTTACQRNTLFLLITFAFFTVLNCVCWRLIIRYSCIYDIKKFILLFRREPLWGGIPTTCFRHQSVEVLGISECYPNIMVVRDSKTFKQLGKAHFINYSPKALVIQWREN